MVFKSNDPQVTTSDQFPANYKSQEISNIKSEYKKFIKAMDNKNYSLDCSESRFKNLATDLNNNKILKKSLAEAKTALKLEAKGFVKDV